MKLTPHFTLEEFTRSDTAARLGIDNRLPPQLMWSAEETAHLMERIRAYLSDLAKRDIPIEVTSGYRCSALNQAIGSKPSSDHVRMLAVDFKVPEFGSPYAVAEALRPAVHGLQIGQLIYEFGSWVHVSTRITDLPINRILTITSRGTSPGILKG
jgi:zinc D-Ala-D-Ala carboxypeptidase